MLPPSFVINFVALLLFGPRVALVVATVGALTPAVVSLDSARLRRETFVDVVSVMVAIECARLPYRALAGSPGSSNGHGRRCRSRLPPSAITSLTSRLQKLLSRS